MAEVRSPRLGPRGLAVIAGVAAVQGALHYALVRPRLHDAMHDPLTGLPNRRAVDRRLRAVRGDAALAVLDLDGFKSVNDAFSHSVGDAVLVAVVECLRGCLRKTDVLARPGGDEFVAILPATPLGHAEAALRRAASAVAALPRAVAHGVTVSIGVTDVMVESDPLEALERADAAMYRAKRSGGGHVVVAPWAAARSA